MELQYACRNLFCYRAVDHGLHDFGLALAKRNENDAPRVHNRLDSHRHRSGGHFIDGSKEAGVGLSCGRSEHDLMRDGTKGGARFVKSDVTVISDALLEDSVNGTVLL